MPREGIPGLPAGKTAQKVVWVLQVMEKRNIVPSSYFKKLEGTEDIWECRVLHGSNTYRILGFFAGHATLVLTHGFIKKSQKTPAREIARAENCKKDFLSRRKDHGDTSRRVAADGLRVLAPTGP